MRVQEVTVALHNVKKDGFGVNNLIENVHH